MEEEREKLFKVDSLEVLDYIRQSVEILMNMKGEEMQTYTKNQELQEHLIKKKELEAQNS